MNYEKPVIVVTGPAMTIVQGSKPVGGFADMNPTRRQTVAAYEADE